MNIIVISICLLLALRSSSDEVSDEYDYIDPVVDFLLNGADSTRSGDNFKDDAAILTTGIWKCGNCTNIDDSKIVYSEENHTDADNGETDTQIELILEGMRCVTVSSDKPGVVQRVTGACDGAVILQVKPSQHFIVHVYI